MSAEKARQDWLALEHEAIWLHSLVGARFPALTPRARASYAAHRTVRDRLLVTLRQAGVEPEGQRRGVSCGDEPALGLRHFCRPRGLPRLDPRPHPTVDLHQLP